MRRLFSLVLIAAGLMAGAMSAQAGEMPTNAKAYGYVQFGQGAEPVYGEAVLFNTYDALLRLPNKDAKIKLTDTIYADVYAKGRHKSFKYNTGIVLPPYTSSKPWLECNALGDQSLINACHDELDAYMLSHYGKTYEQFYNDSVNNRVTVTMANAAVEGGLQINNFYDFTNASFKVNVINGTTKSFVYTVTGGNDAENFRLISGVTDAEAVKAAAQHAKTQFGRSTATVTEVCLKSGSSLCYGEEILTLHHDIVLGKNDANMEKLLRAISENSEIGHRTDMSDTCKAVLTVLAGSYVSARGEKAELQQDMTVTVDATAFNTSAPVMKTLLSTIKAYADQNKRTEFFRTLVQWANCMAAKVEGATLLPVDVEFAQIPWTVIRGINADGEEGYVAGDHKLAAGEIGTFVTPWALDQLRGGVAFNLEYRNNSVAEEVTEVTLVQAQYPLHAYQPYVFIASGEALEAILSEETAIYGVNGDGLTENFNGLIGYCPGDESLYTIPYAEYVNCGIVGNKIVWAGNNAQIKDGTAYINMTDVSTVSSSAPGRRVKVGSGKVTTAIETVVTEAPAISKQIVNGQLLIVKDGVRYNAQGQIVK